MNHELRCYGCIIHAPFGIELNIAKGNSTFKIICTLIHLLIKNVRYVRNKKGLASNVMPKTAKDLFTLSVLELRIMN